MLQKVLDHVHYFIALAAIVQRCPSLDLSDGLGGEAVSHRLALLVSLGGSSVGVVGVSFRHGLFLSLIVGRVAPPRGY